MLRCVLLAVALAVSPMLAYADPKEDSQAVFDRFLSGFTNADVDAVVGAFWPDALFWGTIKRDLIATPEAIREYFTLALGSRKPNELKATSLATSSLVVSDSIVLISGQWQVERVVEGKPTLTPLRVSIAVTKRGDDWGIAQFHNSLRPAP